MFCKFLQFCLPWVNKMNHLTLTSKLLFQNLDCITPHRRMFGLSCFIKYSLRYLLYLCIQKVDQDGGVYLTVKQKCLFYLLQNKSKVADSLKMKSLNSTILPSGSMILNANDFIKYLNLYSRSIFAALTTYCIYTKLNFRALIETVSVDL